MALYAIGDLHLSLGTDKPMDVFPGWDGYVEKLSEGFSALNDDDVTILCGDLSWGLSLEDSVKDFAFIDKLPGKKIVLKGNHDYWWNTRSKLQKFFDEHAITTIEILHNNCFFYGDIAICGTRGWFFEEDFEGSHDEKVFKRELMRLETSLKAAGDKRKFCFLHYPPRYFGYLCQEIIDLMAQYGVEKCCYGHLHGGSHKLAEQGKKEGIEYLLVAADYVEFTPVKLVD